MMNWSEGAENLLTALAKMVPETLRELATISARDEAEGVVAERGANEVDVDDAMRGWIKMTPPEQRNGLIAVIESLGLEPERYAEDLENAEGWDDEESDNKYEEPPETGMCRRWRVPFFCASLGVPGRCSRARSAISGRTIRENE